LEALAGDDFAQLDAKIFKSEDLLPNIHSVRVPFEHDTAKLIIPFS
jgi:hypothetical protein